MDRIKDNNSMRKGTLDMRKWVMVFLSIMLMVSK